MIRYIYEHYHLQVKELIPLGHYKSFWIRNQIYVLFPIGNLEEDELIEMKNLSDYMRQQGDQTVMLFVPNIHGYYVTEIEETNYCLLTGTRFVQNANASLGNELAVFHKRGAYFPSEVEHLRRIGEWKALWEKRIEQLERFWQSKVANHPTDTFDQMFIESFPYYLGIAENAIQYVADTELDDTPQFADAATICQERFSPSLWKSTQQFKIPADWVFDHPSRDLAEWIRTISFEKKGEWKQTISQFLTDYERVYPLSSFGWRLLFARLLFPLHYFETAEQYYLTGNEAVREIYRDRLEMMLADVRQTEQFIGSFFQLARTPVRKTDIRKLDWL
ncbi:spore coat protein CotS [Bacillus manliponensis]|uniref:Spore coat protein CotS n=1 Tax=Bacillus manliponensis TaxID=574376 RepID=A0A073JU71_9BACI|nr:spore coat protein YutH [Bacillus manliponensis]KEK17845.1 spore coat protein CotS [Bacillus manliponensis]